MAIHDQAYVDALTTEERRSVDFEYPIVPDYAGRQPYGTQHVDWEQRIDMDRLRNYRVGRVQEQLRLQGVGAILAINEWNMRYITSTWNPYWTTPASGLRYALLTVNDGPVLFEQGEIGYHTRNIAPWLRKVKVAITGAGWIGQTMGPHAWETQRRKMVAQIAGEMAEAGLSGERLAIDAWDPTLVDAFQRAGIEVVSGTSVMWEARKLKNVDEVECLRTCCTIGDAMFGTLAENLRPGVRESELVGLVHKKAYDLGAQIYSGVFVTSGPFSWPNPRDESDRIIRPGDSVYMDVYNTSYLGYKICYYRTFSCGKASREIKDAYQRSYEWLQESIAAIKPGATTRDVATKWPSGPEVWGDILVETEDQTAGSNWAHGIGLTLYEPPIIWRAVSLEDPVELQEGMTFAIETQHGVRGVGGVRIEEVVHVTATGVEVLSKWPADEIAEVPLY